MTLQEIRQEFSSLLHHYAPFAASTTFLHAHCTMHYALCTMHYMHHVRGSDFAREFSSHTDTALLWCSTTGRSVLHNTLHWSKFSPHPTPLNRGRQDDTDVAHRAHSPSVFSLYGLFWTPSSTYSCSLKYHSLHYSAFPGDVFNCSFLYCGWNSFAVHLTDAPVVSNALEASWMHQWDAVFQASSWNLPHLAIFQVQNSHLTSAAYF